MLDRIIQSTVNEGPISGSGGSVHECLLNVEEKTVNFGERELAGGSRLSKVRPQFCDIIALEEDCFERASLNAFNYLSVN
jgi:hypothetical protein